MKILLFICGLLSFTSIYSQSFEFMKPLENNTKFRYNTVYNFNGYKNVYYYQDSREYQVYDNETGEFLSKKIPEITFEGQTGKVLSLNVVGDEIFELVRFIKSKFTTKCNVGIIKRSAKDLSQISITVLPEEFGIFNSEENPNVVFHFTENGFYLLSGRQYYGKPINFLAYYDLDMKEQWKRPMEFLQEEGVQVNKFEIFEKGNAIVELHVQNVQKGFQFKQSTIIPTAVSFLAVNVDGEVDFIAPQMDKGFIFSHSRIFYDFAKEELSGVYIINEMTNPKKEKLSGTGYAFLKWNKSGELLASAQKMFTIGEVWNKDVKPYLEANGVKSTSLPADLFPRLTYQPVITWMKDGSFIFYYSGLTTDEPKMSKQNELLKSSDFGFAITSEGVLKWINFAVSTNNTRYSWGNAVTDGTKYYYLVDEYPANVASKEYRQAKASINTVDFNSVLFFEEIDPETGQVLSFVQATIPSEFKNYEPFVIVDRTPNQIENKWYTMSFTNKKENKLVQTILNF